MHRLRVFKVLRGSASLCPDLEYRAQGSAERWTAGLGSGAFARAAAVRAAAAPTSEASNKRSCPCVRIWRESSPPPCFCAASGAVLLLKSVIKSKSTARGGEVWDDIVAQLQLMR